MKPTVELPDELLRAVKVRAATENRRLKDVMAELIAAGLGSGSVPGRASIRHRVRLPLIRGGHA
ncbi:MAG: antitoxin, partial [Candidatus Dormibacteraceae bacterium]